MSAAAPIYNWISAGKVEYVADRRRIDSHLRRFAVAGRERSAGQCELNVTHAATTGHTA